MKVLLTGANGFLGVHLGKLLLDNNYHLVATGTREEPLLTRHKRLVYERMDITDPFDVHDVFEKHKPGVVIHTAAVTMVDSAEQHQWKAFSVNVEGTLTLLANAENLKSFFIFLSTDFVFDGSKGNYSETDERGPVNYYGNTKVDAEDAVMEYPYNWSIVRTSLVYGKNITDKHNILSLIKEKLEEGEEYGLVNDQVRSPTYVEDLAKGILMIMQKQATGIFHLSGKDVLTPYQMGKAVVGFLKKDPLLIKELSASIFSQPAKRPWKTNLNIDKARNILGYEPMSFEEGLRRSLED